MPVEGAGRVDAILAANPLFSALDPAELEQLRRRTAVRKYAAGEVLFSEGDACAGLFVVITGRVRIFKTSSGGREQVLAIEGPGSSIAELPVFDGGPYPASVAALEPSELAFVSRADFRTLCLEHPQVALKVLQVVGARLRRLVGIIEELSFTTLRHRLISWLLREARTQGTSSGGGLVFTLGVSHQELAARVGTVRELVSRNLARLQAQGMITIEGRQVVIPDVAALEAELDSIL